MENKAGGFVSIGFNKENSGVELRRLTSSSMVRVGTLMNARRRSQVRASAPLKLRQ
jgi:hypothetical protein